MQQALNQIKTLMIEGINRKTIALTVLATLAFVGFMNVAVYGAEFAQYGSIGQEDELFTYHNGEYWVNIVLEKGNGQFMSTGLEGSYSIDEAIKEFGIYEDTESFIIEPEYNGKFSNVLFLYEIDGY